MKKVFITGGSGTVGEAFISNFYDKYKFYSYSRNEKMQVSLKRRFEDIEVLIGAVEDKITLTSSIVKIKPDIVIHAAALKHVDSAQKSPIAAVKSNIIGSLNVIEGSIEGGVPIVLGVSTDKACVPDNIYGYSKHIMEKMFLESYTSKNKFLVCRFGNISYSHGSVVPYWLSRKSKNQSLPLTDKKMNRLMIGRKSAAHLINKAIENCGNSKGPFVLTQRMKAVNIFTLAKLISNDIEIVGTRPGEKLNETLISKEEVNHTFCEGNYIFIREAINSGNNKLLEEYSSTNSEFMDKKEMMELLEDADENLLGTLLKKRIY